MTQLGVNQTTPSLGGQPTYQAPSTLANNMNSTASTDYANYMAAQQALTARTGTISQLLSQGANQYQGQVSAAQGASAEAQTAQQTAQQNYTNLYNQAQQQYQNQMAQQSLLAGQNTAAIGAQGGIDASALMAAAYGRMGGGGGGVSNPVTDAMNQANAVNSLTTQALSKLGKNPSDYASQNAIYNLAKQYSGNSTIDPALWNYWQGMQGIGKGTNGQYGFNVGSKPAAAPNTTNYINRWISSSN